MPVVGFLNGASPGPHARFVAAFRQGPLMIPLEVELGRILPSQRIKQRYSVWTKTPMKRWLSLT
jgi:hypothetical protein